MKKRLTPLFILLAACATAAVVVLSKKEATPATLPQTPEPTPQPESSLQNKNKVVVLLLIIIAVLVGFCIGLLCTGHAAPQSEAESEEMMSYITTVQNITCYDNEGEAFTYTGEAIDGEIPHGEGTGIYNYGTYVGHYENGLREGKGEFRRKSNTFKGTFHNDDYEYGTLTLTDDGSYFTGDFRDGCPYTGTWYDADGKIDYEIQSGEEQLSEF